VRLALSVAVLFAALAGAAVANTRPIVVRVRGRAADMNAFVRVVVNVLVMGALLATAASAATSMTIPVHGTALAIPTRGVVVAVLDGIPAMYPSQTRRYRSTARFRTGETFDAYLDPRTATLEDVNAAAEFVPGLPNHLVTHVMARGDQLPDYRFIAQNGRSMRFSNFRGKVLLLSFIYTRCPDVSICPAISGKFAYLQRHLDPRHFQLGEMTLDPLADSPAVLAAYAKQFGADPAIWSLITGESAQVKNVLDSFALDPLETNPGRIIHGDTLVILGSDGKIADLIPTSGWVPDDVLATANDVAGLSSNPLRRFELATVAGVIAFCGGKPLDRNRRARFARLSDRGSGPGRPLSVDHQAHHHRRALLTPHSCAFDRITIGVQDITPGNDSDQFSVRTNNRNERRVCFRQEGGSLFERRIDRQRLPRGA